MKWKYFVFVILSCSMLAACSDDDKNATGCDIDDFLGPWDMTEQCGTSDFQYQLTVTKLASGIRLANIGGGGANAYVDATVDGAAFTFAPQTVQGFTLSGNGTLNAGCAQLTMSWQGGPNGSCAGTATK